MNHIHITKKSISSADDSVSNGIKMFGGNAWQFENPDTWEIIYRAGITAVPKCSARS